MSDCVCCEKTKVLEKLVAKGLRSAAHALRRIAGGGDGRVGIVCGFDEGNQEVVEADVEQLLDFDPIVPFGPHNRMDESRTAEK